MPTYEQPKEFTFTCELAPRGSDNFRRFILGEWNPKLSNQEKLNPDNIEKVIFNPPATIVIFKDGTKVIAKTHNEDFDEEKGFMACMMKIMFPSRTKFNRVIDKGIEESLNRK